MRYLDRDRERNNAKSKSLTKLTNLQLIDGVQREMLDRQIDEEIDGWMNRKMRSRDGNNASVIDGDSNQRFTSPEYDISPEESSSIETILLKSAESRGLSKKTKKKKTASAR